MMTQKNGRASEIADDPAASAFRAYLESIPDAKQILQQRRESLPGYDEWLQSFGSGVISALEPAGK